MCLKTEAASRLVDESCKGKAIVGLRVGVALGIQADSKYLQPGRSIGLPRWLQRQNI
jgi:hypothetical protein